MVLVIFQYSALYRRVLKTLLLYSLILVFVLMFLDLHVLIRVANAWLAFEIVVAISFSVSPLVVILEPRYVKSFISSISSPFSMMAASVLLFILKCFVFLVLIFSPISPVFLSCRRSWLACPDVGVRAALYHPQNPSLPES